MSAPFMPRNVRTTRQIPKSSCSSNGDLMTHVKDSRTPQNEVLFFGGLHVLVKAGNGDKSGRFSVHQCLVTGRSRIFMTTNPGWSLVFGQWNLDLPEVDPEIFRLWLHLLYTDRLATKGDHEWLTLCRLYVLAETLEDRKGKNQIIDGMHAFIHSDVLKSPLCVNTKAVLPVEAIQELYKGTTSENKARKLVIDLFADSGDESWLVNGRPRLPVEFVYEVAVRLMQKRSSTLFGSSVNRPSSYYHEVVPIDKPSCSAVELEKLVASTVVTPPQTPVVTPSQTPEKTTPKVTEAITQLSFTEAKREKAAPQKAELVFLTPEATLHAPHRKSRRVDQSLNSHKSGSASLVAESFLSPGLQTVKTDKSSGSPPLESRTWLFGTNPLVASS